MIHQHSLNEHMWSVKVLMLYSLSDESRGCPDEHEYATPDIYRDEGGDAFVDINHICEEALFKTKAEAEVVFMRLKDGKLLEKDIDGIPDNYEDFMIVEGVVEFSKDSNGKWIELS